MSGNKVYMLCFGYNGEITVEEGIIFLYQAPYNRIDNSFYSGVHVYNILCKAFPHLEKQNIYMRFPFTEYEKDVFKFTLYYKGNIIVETSNRIIFYTEDETGVKDLTPKQIDLIKETLSKRVKVISEVPDENCHLAVELNDLETHNALTYYKEYNSFSNDKKQLENLPLVNQERIKGTLSAYNTVYVEYEFGKFRHTTSISLTAHKREIIHLNSITNSIFTEDEMIENYINNFWDVPINYQGARRRELYDNLKELKRTRRRVKVKDGVIYFPKFD